MFPKSPLKYQAVQENKSDFALLSKFRRSMDTFL